MIFDVLRINLGDYFVGDPKETRTPITWMKTMDPNR